MLYLYHNFAQVWRLQCNKSNSRKGGQRDEAIIWNPYSKIGPLSASHLHSTKRWKSFKEREREKEGKRERERERGRERLAMRQSSKRTFTMGGGVSLYRWPPVVLVWIQQLHYIQISTYFLLWSNHVLLNWRPAVQWYIPFIPRNAIDVWLCSPCFTYLESLIFWHGHRCFTTRAPGIKNVKNDKVRGKKGPEMAD